MLDNSPLQTQLQWSAFDTNALATQTALKSNDKNEIITQTHSTDKSVTAATDAVCVRSRSVITISIPVTQLVARYYPRNAAVDRASANLFG